MQAKGDLSRNRIWQMYRAQECRFRLCSKSTLSRSDFVYLCCYMLSFERCSFVFRCHVFQLSSFDSRPLIAYKQQEKHFASDIEAMLQKCVHSSSS